MSEERGSLERLTRQRMLRRRFLYLTGAAGLLTVAASGLACGPSAPQQVAPATKTAPAAPAPQATSAAPAAAATAAPAAATAKPAPAQAAPARARGTILDSEELLATVPPEILERLQVEPKKDWTEKDIQRGGKLVQRDFRDIPHLDPFISTANNIHQIAGLVYSRLVQIQAEQDADPLQLTIVPDLAKSWEISPDGLVYTFKLHENAKWQNVPPVNGRPVTAEDVRWCLERYATLKESVQRGTLELVKAFDAIDKNTLRITLKEPHVPMLTKLGSSFLSIVPREVVEQSDPRNTAVGSGPFILKEVQRGAKYVARKNPDYFIPGIPYIDEYEHVIMPDDAAALAAFRSGQLDFAPAGSVEQIKNLLATNPNATGQRSYSFTGSYSINMRLDKAPFNDVRVRRALAMAIDRGRINKVVFQGRGKIGTVIPWNAAGFKSIPTAKEFGPYYKMDPDVEGAKQLLKEAGLPNGFEAVMTTGYAQVIQLMNSGQLVVEDWKRIGVNVKLVTEDYTAWSAKHFTGNFEQMELSQLGTIGFDIDDWTYGYLHSKATNNWWHLNDPEADKVLEAQRKETDPEKRTALIRTLFDMENAQIWRLQLINPGVSFSIWSPRLRNYKSLSYTSGAAYGNHIMNRVWLKQS